ncbi:hypothetical protein [Pedobacter alluvionis]|uniref:Leucine-rich repeat domain-containing protein n=1 Tax=Pedobacter alluvionis TaxID=475253 RepID=A0A497Y4X3_9SPHI|nr:hypothetical protein [Pedobacter alluvionis]RLJ75118.1 hypothetical protein BCL90_3466 [Pedobacter alluvionis]TFB30222.1 hypothetical protein E3V97_18815 [Pedobacter alluvionis]
MDIDGFNFSKDGKTLAIRGGDNLQNEIEYIKVTKIKSVSINSVSIKDLNFLNEIDFIEEIYLNKFDIDYLGLYELKNLKKITINIHNPKPKPNIDYTQFKKLEYLSVDWYNDGIDLSENTHLKRLIIWKFKPKTKSFSYIKLPASLESFEITESNIQNFDGLILPNLKSFEGHYCSKLTSLDGLKKSSDNLQSFILGSCGNLTNYDDLKYCKNLEKIILTRCGDMQSLSWLKSLKKVKHFTFLYTKVIDGDVSLCSEIKYVAFTNSRHYDHKMEEFNDKYK